MKTLLIESGSSKTAWVLLDGSQTIKRIVTRGFNPNYHDEQELKAMITKELQPQLNNAFPDQIIYYGAGCSTGKNCTIVSETFKSVFPHADVRVMTDILGAAHALFGQKPGIACVLGTGSNVALYDGQAIIHQVPSLGYLFSDEGSGVHIGKKFITSFLFGELDEPLRTKFLATANHSREEILHRIYRQELPSLFLAEIARFVGNNVDDPFCKQLVESCFDDFIRVLLQRVPEYQSYKLGFTGSIAWNFKDILQNRLHLHNLHDMVFLHDPSIQLSAYHGSQLDQ